MADLKDSGLRYCIAHEGVVDVDQETCDFHRFDSHDFDAVTECVTRPLLFDASDIGGLAQSNDLGQSEQGPNR